MPASLSTTRRDMAAGEFRQGQLRGYSCRAVHVARRSAGGGFFFFVVCS